VPSAWPDRQRGADRGEPVARGAAIARCAQRDRYQRAQLEPLGAHVAEVEEAAQRAADHREHHVVDRAPKAVADRLEVRQAAGHRDEPPVGPDRHVQRCGRRRVERRPDHFADAGKCRAHVRCGLLRPDRRRERVREQGHTGLRVASRGERHELRHARAARRSPVRLARVALVFGVQDDRCQIDAGDAVGHRVVSLQDQGEAVVRQSRDEPQLPQRAAAIELGREDLREHREQLLVSAGCGEGGAAHVEIEPKPRVVDPHRAAAVKRRVRQPLAVARHAVQARADRRQQLAECRRRAVDDRQGADVHVGLGPLLVQERSVERGEPVKMPRRHLH
jgi:hypothetical protein